MPSSHLTRQVFRRLLANEPIVHRGCLRRRAYSTAVSYEGHGFKAQRHNARQPVSNARLEQRRGFFNMNMFRKQKRETKEADMDPGLETMMQLERLTRLRARLPSREDVAKAVTDFFEAKFSATQAIEDNQAKLVLQSLRYCLPATEGEGELGEQALVSNRVLWKAATALKRTGKQSSPDHVMLARMLYDKLKLGLLEDDKTVTQAYMTQLCASGSASTAQDVLLEFEDRRGLDQYSGSAPVALEDAVEIDVVQASVTNQDAEGEASGLGFRRNLWTLVLRAWALQNRENEVSRTLELIRAKGLFDDTTISIPMVMLRYSIARSDIDGIKHWWHEFHNRLVGSTRPPKANKKAAEVIGKTLQWCMMEEQLELGHSIVRALMQTTPIKLVWDAIFVWAAGTGKGVDEIGRMLDVMEQSNEAIKNEDHWRRPNAATINALVEYANSKDDPYMAERFIALGRERGIEPDARTLRVSDIDGALIAYKSLQSMETSTDEDVPAVNKLIVALSSSKRHDFDTVMNVAADLSDRRARFEPLTVATLSLLHLDRDELHDVIDLLNTHAYHYSSTERTTVRDTIVAYCLNNDTPVARSWDAYTIIRNVFDELPRGPRTELMTSFFERDRPDMAVHVFNHMRSHSRTDTMPTPDTYITAFLGTAKRHDLESLEVVHNQLKLDFNINLNTQLRNALIIAYTSCSRPRKALQFWDDIVASKEGPSYNSIHIALRACERSPFGDLKANEIWGRLRKMNVELDSTMWASYVAALAGNGDSEHAINVLEEADRKGEVEVDAFVLGSLFMGSSGMEKQGYVEQWAKGKYAKAWAELEAFGVEEAEDGMRAFGIDRSVSP
ncbi:hypothetical protein LTR56_017349 [Elasticomyces elasticus]|nr:hypothetical protein LTR56_017349 [Elasticomyces elasticus]KAK3664479.1 hypothetical protein LTR22_004613 [Elasticomyces elasticus]KAK4931800.1 hypothetical protein LTR49_001865 [Elasticomyces elasticus]KAK5762888.1 hypothetical protein LTS12_006875 [Elasticomyces elasticus]